MRQEGCRESRRRARLAVASLSLRGRLRPWCLFPARHTPQSIGIRYQVSVPRPWYQIPDLRYQIPETWPPIFFEGTLDGPVEMVLEGPFEGTIHACERSTAITFPKTLTVRIRNDHSALVDIMGISPVEVAGHDWLRRHDTTHDWRCRLCDAHLEFWSERIHWDACPEEPRRWYRLPRRLVAALRRVQQRPGTSLSPTRRYVLRRQDRPVLNAKKLARREPQGGAPHHRTARNSPTGG